MEVGPISPWTMGLGISPSMQHAPQVPCGMFHSDFAETGSSSSSSSSSRRTRQINPSTLLMPVSCCLSVYLSVHVSVCLPTVCVSRACTYTHEEGDSDGEEEKEVEREGERTEQGTQTVPETQRQTETGRSRPDKTTMSTTRLARRIRDSRRTGQTPAPGQGSAARGLPHG